MGGRSKQTLLQRRHTDGQKAHEKTFNITNYQRNANQNYNKVSPHTGQNGRHQKVYKQSCNKHFGTRLFLNYGFLRVYAQQQDCGVVWQFYFQFFKEPPYCSPQWLYPFTFPPTVQEGSLFSTPSPAFTVCRLFDDDHSDRCEMISHCSFDLHFSND